MFKPVSPKIDFPDLERKILKNWYQKGIVKKYLAKNSQSRNKFSFIDGPITANNPMGVHHAWGRTYKDLWQRFFAMRGFDQRFQNGFDEQGLWIEVEVEKELGLKTKKDIENLVKGKVFESIEKFVNLCKERVKKFSAVQTEQSKRLGYFMDWENSYHTSSEENNYSIWHYLKKVYEKGWLFKGKDSVPWCPRCGTAISQHEILTEEYQEIVHKAVFVKYKLKDSDENLLVWTTTPWTLPSNVAVAVHPDFLYGVWQNSKTDEKIIFVRTDSIEELERDLVSQVFGNETDKWSCLKDIKGKDLIGREYEGIFDDLPALKGVSHKIIGASDLVTAEEGTGLVHIAPGAGKEDFDIAQREKLAIISSIDEEANYIEGFADLTGKNAKDDPSLVIDKLTEKGVLFKVENYTHRYPTCWRCKTELVWRVVDEWYIAVDRVDPKTKKTYREMMKDVIKEINWIPKWGYDRELDWLNNLHDWLISKKRYWGLALPIWQCQKCSHFEVIGSYEELKEKAIEGWKDFEGKTPHRPWIDQVKIKCTSCGETVSRIPDVGNVWLDAGIVPFSTLKYFENKKYWQDWFPADFITESFPGQFKNWFYSLIAMSTALENKAPFKTLLGHGQVRDEKGEEMHKSKGNAIWFEEAAEKMGVDVMRWIYLTTNPEHNVSFGYHVADVVRRRFFLIFWNVYVFFVTYANISKWRPSGTEKADLSDPLDRWIISELNLLIKKVNQSMEKYDAQSSSTEIEKFILDLSTWYVRRIRDRVGISAKDTKIKENTYQILYSALTILCRLIAPFTPFISEEMYQNLTDEESVHLANFPLADEKIIDEELGRQMQQIRKLAEVAHSERKKEGIKLRQPLQSFSYGKENERLSPELENILADEINVKEVTFVPKTSFSLNTALSKELIEEGKAREIIRQIQEKRKEAGVNFDDQIIVSLPDWPKKFEDLIKRETLAKTITNSESLEIAKV